MSLQDVDRASLLLRNDGSIAKCDDGSVIIQYVQSLRCCIIDPVKNRQFLLEVFGPEIVNKCIETNDGSSGSGESSVSKENIWNETTISILLKSLKLFKRQFISNTEKEVLYLDIANLMNSHDLEHFYTATQCEEKVMALTKEYSFQLFKNYAFDTTSNDPPFKYFEELHDIFADDFPVTEVFSKELTPSFDMKFNLLRKELKSQYKTVLKNQKASLVIQRRIKKAFLTFEKFIEDMKKGDLD